MSHGSYCYTSEAEHTQGACTEGCNRMSVVKSDGSSVELLPEDFSVLLNLHETADTGSAGSRLLYLTASSQPEMGGVLAVRLRGRIFACRAGLCAAVPRPQCWARMLAMRGRQEQL